MRTGENASQARVLKAHAVLQGLRGNPINALELLAKQQEDGDSPIQSIVAGLCERSRKGVVESLRNFIEVDNRSALEVGYLKKGTRSFEVRSQNARRRAPRCQSGKIPRN